MSDKKVNVNVSVKEITSQNQPAQQNTNQEVENTEEQLGKNKDVNVNVKVVKVDDYNQFVNKPSINGVVLEGDKSLADLGIYNFNGYTYEQGISSDVWVIQHNLNKHPSVTVVDSAGNEVVGHVHYDDLNNVTVTFTSPFSGKAYLN